jgi:general secretion pathway protein G
MKFRCPYCKQIIEGEPRALCPHCGKAMNIPDRFSPPDAGERRKARERIRREAERQRKTIFVPQFALARKPSHIILALAILALVGGLLVGRARRRYDPPRKRKPEAVAQKELNVLRTAVEQFRRDVGRYPRTDEGLPALIRDPGSEGWSGPYVNLIRPDPWRHHYLYELNEDDPTILSLGPDGKRDTADDLRPFLTSESRCSRPRRRVEARRTRS